MITELVAQRFGCLKAVRLGGLTRLHALVGPNDSGKSTILEALRIGMAGEVGTIPSDPRMTSQAVIELHTGLGRKIVGIASVDFHPPSPREVIDREALRTATTGVRAVRFDPDAIRQPSGLIPEEELPRRWHPSGAGLPAWLQLLRLEAFTELSSRLRRLFPAVAELRVVPKDAQNLELRVELTDGTLVRPHQLSEGLLYYLGFETLRLLTPVPLLLVEEPENGLHPARIREVVKVLREISATTQVVLATHSPLVVNELAPEEVTVVTRPDVAQGTKVTPLRDTPNFAKRSSVYALGELWLAYCDGQLERPLFEPPEGGA